MVTLQSGREIDLKPISFFKRAEIIDMALEMYYKGVPVSLQVCGKCLQYSLGLSEKELGEWSDNEIYEAGNLIFVDLQKSELDKKK